MIKQTTNLRLYIILKVGKKRVSERMKTQPETMISNAKSKLIQFAQRTVGELIEKKKLNTQSRCYSQCFS